MCTGTYFVHPWVYYAKKTETSIEGIDIMYIKKQNKKTRGRKG
jgi:hypothetical protein